MLLYPRHINEHVSIYVCMTCIYTWELLIFLDIKVCGCNSACVYSTVIVSWSDICDIDVWATSISRLVGLAPKLELLAVFSSSDILVGARIQLVMHCCEQKCWCVNRP